MDFERIFSKKNWQGKNWIRQLNRERIDAGRDLVLFIVRFLFDRALPARKKNQKLDPQQIKKVLIFHFDDKIGDMVINTILFRELKKINKNIKIDIVTGKNSFDLVDGHPFLNQIFIFKKGLLQTLLFAKQMKKQKYDLVIDPRLMTDARTIYILNQIQPKWAIGFHKQNYKIYTDSIELDLNALHMSEKIKSILTRLNIQNVDLKYSILTTPAIQSETEALLKKYKLQNHIILNLYAGARFRSFLPLAVKNIIQLIRSLNIQNPIVLVGPPTKSFEIQELAQSLNTQNVYFIPELKKITSLSGLIEKAKLTISPDTSIVHIASAFNTPVIDVICDDSGQKEKNTIQWGPKSSFSKMIIASGKTDGEVDVNTFSLDDLKKALRELFP